MIKQTVTCDACGKEIGRWYMVNVSIGAKHNWQNVSDMIKMAGELQICKDCFEKAFKNLKECKNDTL